MLIHELAKATGFSVDTIRYYEKLGILGRPVRRGNGYRDYPPNAEACLRLCRRAKELGFTLKELRQLGALLDARRLDGTTMRSRLEVKLAELDAKLVQLTALRDEVARTLAQPSVFALPVASTPAGSGAHATRAGRPRAAVRTPRREAR